MWIGAPNVVGKNQMGKMLDMWICCNINVLAVTKLIKNAVGPFAFSLLCMKANDSIQIGPKSIAKKTWRCLICFLTTKRHPSLRVVRSKRAARGRARNAPTRGARVSHDAEAWAARKKKRHPKNKQNTKPKQKRHHHMKKPLTKK